MKRRVWQYCWRRFNVSLYTQFDIVKLIKLWLRLRLYTNCIWTYLCFLFSGTSSTTLSTITPTSGDDEKDKDLDSVVISRTLQQQEQDVASNSVVDITKCESSGVNMDGSSSSDEQESDDDDSASSNHDDSDVEPSIWRKNCFQTPAPGHLIVSRHQHRVTLLSVFLCTSELLFLFAQDLFAFRTDF